MNREDFLSKLYDPYKIDMHGAICLEFLEAESVTIKDLYRVYRDYAIADNYSHSTQEFNELLSRFVGNELLEGGLYDLSATEKFKEALFQLKGYDGLSIENLLEFFPDFLLVQVEIITFVTNEDQYTINDSVKKEHIKSINYHLFISIGSFICLAAAILISVFTAMQTVEKVLLIVFTSLLSVYGLFKYILVKNNQEKISLYESKSTSILPISLHKENLESSLIKEEFIKMDLEDKSVFVRKEKIGLIEATACKIILLDETQDVESTILNGYKTHVKYYDKESYKSQNLTLHFIFKKDVTEDDRQMIDAMYSYDLVKEHRFIKNPVYMPLLYDTEMRRIYFKDALIPYELKSTLNHGIKFLYETIFKIPYKK